jgi:hypothetical protein
MSQAFPNPAPPAGPTSPEVLTILETIKGKK